jgi:hypothetical protein
MAVTAADSIGKPRTESLALAEYPVAKRGCRTDEEKDFHAGGFRLKTATATWATAATMASRTTSDKPDKEGGSND